MRFLSLNAPTQAQPAFIYQAAYGLGQRGYEVTVACPAPSDVARHALAHGLDTIELPSHPSWLNTAWRLREAMRARAVDALFVSTADAQRVGVTARRLGSHAVVVRHEPTLEQIGVDLVSFDQVAPASRAGLRAPPDGPIVVCWCGVDARMRAVQALRAIARVAERHADLHTVVIGPGAGDDMVRMHAAALRTHGGLAFISDQAVTRRALRAADIGWVAAGGGRCGVRDAGVHGSQGACCRQ